MEIIDQLNRTIFLDKTPKRIISLVPSQTELLIDLGLEENIVGVTKFCVHPNYIRKNKTIVGGTKKVDIKKIKALQPDFILCNKEENTKEMVENLQKISPVWISDIYSIEDNLQMILNLGYIFNVEGKANKLVKNIQFQKQEFLSFIKNKPFQKVAYLIWKNPYYIAGTNTFINELLNINNFVNISEESISRYPEVSTETLKQAEIILLSTEPFPFKEKDAEKLQKKLKKTVMLVDGEYFSWYGSRLQKAFFYFKKLH